MIKIGLIREGKVPPDKRVPFSPIQVEEIQQRFTDVKVICQTSPHRCYKDDEFKRYRLRCLVEKGNDLTISSHGVV